MKLTLWHGGRNLDTNYKEIQASANGRWEHGPGLYLTNQFDTAVKYAKGGGKVFKVELDFDPSKSIGRTQVELADAIVFVKSHAKKSTSKDVISSLESNSERSKTPGKVGIEILVNLLLNDNALTSAKTKNLAEFLVDSGIQYGVTRYGGRDEVVVIVYDRNIIKKVSPVNPKDIDTADWEIEVPKYDWKGFTGGSLKESKTFKEYMESMV